MKKTEKKGGNKKITTEWNLDLLYKNDTDPYIEKDIQALEKAYGAFEKKYKKIDFTSTPEKLLKALADSEALEEIATNFKPLWYFNLKTYLNSQDTRARALLSKYEKRVVEAQNKITFFDLQLGKIAKPTQSKILKDDRFKKYAYDLKLIFDEAKYMLPEGEEQMLNLLSETSYSKWVDGQEKLLGEQTVEWKGKTLPFPEASALYSDLPIGERRDLYKKMNEVVKNISHFAEAEINAIYTYKAVLDKRRGFTKPYSATLLANENDEKSIEALVETVTKYFSVSKRFYKLHAKLLGEKKLTYADRAAKIGEIKKKFNFEESVDVVRKTFAKIDPKYGDILDEYIKNGQIDFFPKKGKQGGAFCTGVGKLPTFVFLNHINDVNSIETLAHEMGHAFHTDFSKKQPALYQHYTMSVAEVASTFFEQIVLDDLINYLNPDEKIIMLHNKIRGDIQTIFRQIACFNFENELHLSIREKGFVPKEEIAKIMNKNMSAYLGDVFEMKEDDGYFFVPWSHIRNFFYVYAYAFGHLISRALFEKWKKDPTYIKKVEEFLKAGKSMSPVDIFKKIGVDISNPTFFETGLKGIEKDIEML